MLMRSQNRRDFIKTATVSTAAMGMAGVSLLNAADGAGAGGNPLPRWRGFNLTDFNSPNPSSGRGGTTDDDLKWMVDWGFDFIRLPMSYPRYVEFDRTKDITPED